MMHTRTLSTKLTIAGVLLSGMLMLLPLGCRTASEMPTGRPEFAVDMDKKPVRLKATGRFEFEPIAESSGIVKSPHHENLFWTLNDSGDTARIFPVRADGSIVRPSWADDDFDYQGVALPQAVNVDWEDMSVDQDGQLVIGAFGNNANTRRDLSVYIVPEPDPDEVIVSPVLRQVFFRFPDQAGFPPSANNFDCEAVFCAEGKLYFLSKHRTDTRTTLYRLDRQEPGVVHPLTRIDAYNLGSWVTAAEATRDGRRLAVLTGNAVWVFDAKLPGQWFEGRVRWLPLEARQAEAICFIDDATLLITNEQRDVFTLGVDELIPILH